MIKKTLSNPIEILQQQDPYTALSSLTDNEIRVFNVLLKRAATCRYVNISQATIASELEIGLRTVTRAIATLLNKRFIHQNRRFNNSSFTYITPFLLQNYNWHSELSRWFSCIPRLILHLALLGSPMNAGSGSLSGTANSFFNILTFPKGVTMGHSESKERKARAICKALVGRGERLTNEECLNVMAFPEDVLDKACAAMKGRPDIKFPGAYFFSTCRQFTIESKRKPDWTYVQVLRDRKLELLTDIHDKPAVTEHVLHKEPPKRVDSSQPRTISYAPTSKGASLKPKLSEEEIIKERAKFVRENINSDNEFTKMMIAGFVKDPAVAHQIACDELLIEAGAILQKPETPKAQKILAAWAQDEPESPQLNKKDFDNRMIVSGWKKVDYGTTLSLFNVSPTVEADPPYLAGGDWYEEEVCSEGEYSASTPAKAVPRSNV